MPYSDLLMTLIFIKLRFDRAGAGGDPLGPPGVPQTAATELLWGLTCGA
jgi:hypothetical protein